MEAGEPDANAEGGELMGKTTDYRSADWAERLTEGE